MSSREDEEERTDECPHCHADIHEDAERCPYCGHSVVFPSGAARLPLWMVIAALLALGGFVYWEVVVYLRR